MGLLRSLSGPSPEEQVERLESAIGNFQDATFFLGMSYALMLVLGEEPEGWEGYQYDGPRSEELDAWAHGGMRAIADRSDELAET